MHSARAAHRRAQGPVHGAREMGSRQGLSRSCASTASLVSTTKWPRLDRFVEHNIELPVASLTVSARRRGGAARRRWTRRSSMGAASCTFAIDSAAAPRRRAADVFSTKRACPNCGTGFPELDPRLFSFNSKHGWCKSCFGTGLCTGRIRCRAKRRGIRVARRGGLGAQRHSRCADVARRSVPTARASASTPWRATCCFAADRSPRSRACRCRNSPPRLRKFKLRGRERDIARDLLRGTRVRAPRSCATSAWAICSSTAPRPRSPAARRSASGWRRSSARTCRGCATCWTNPPSACTRATTVALLDTLGQAARQGQYPDRGRARRGHDTPRRSRDRPGSRRGHARRPLGGARHRRRSSPASDNSATGRCLAAPLTHSRVSAPSRRSPRQPSIRHPRRDPAQLAPGRCAHSARAA